MSAHFCASSRCWATTGVRTMSNAVIGRYGVDGTRIPVSIVHRADIEFPAPALVYGYGAYEIL